MDAAALDKFDEECGMAVDPVAEAREALLAHQKAMGIQFENPDAPVAPDAKALAYMSDEEIGGEWMGKRD